MSNGYDSDFDDDDQRTDEPDWLRILRKSERTLKKEKAELEKQLADLQKQGRASSIKSLLEAKGVPAKTAALVPDSVEATDEAVEAWLDEWSDVLNIKREEPQEQASEASAESGEAVSENATQAPALPPELAAALQRMQQVEAGAQTAPATEHNVAKLVEADQGAQDFDSFISAYNDFVAKSRG